MFGIGEVEEGKIYIFYGKMGSGKTTNAMLQVVKFHKRGQPVWVNFPLVSLPPRKGADPTEPCRVWFEPDPSGILSMRGGLFVIDEAYLTLNSREWQNLDKRVFTAFTHVRKLHMTVIIVAQSWMRIDKSIREVASYAREFRGSSLFGRLYQYVDYEVDETGDIVKKPPAEYETAMRGASIVGKSVYASFDTDQMFGDQPHKDWPCAVGYGPPRAAAAASLSAPLSHAAPRSATILERGGVARPASKIQRGSRREEA